MSDWLRSVVVLGTAFAAVVATTLGLANAMIPEPTSSAQIDPEVPTVGGSPGIVSSEAPEAPPRLVGGTLTITGDRQETVELDREVSDHPYVLAGDDGRVFFEGRPIEPTRIQLDGGLEFFLDPGDCTVTPGDRDGAKGTAPLQLRCAEIEEVRGAAVVTVEGTLRVSADMLGLRGDLPQPGGTVTVGDETLAFNDASLDVAPRPAIGGSPDSDTYLFATNGGGLQFEYDFQTHDLALVGVVLSTSDGFSFGPAGACPPALREIGVLNPRVTVYEMTLRCPAIEFEGIGPLPVEGTVIVDIAGLH